MSDSPFVSLEPDNSPPTAAPAGSPFVSLTPDTVGAPAAPQPMRQMPDFKSENDYQGWVGQQLKGSPTGDNSFSSDSMGGREVTLDPYGNGVGVDLRRMFRDNARVSPVTRQRELDLTPALMDKYATQDSPTLTADSMYAKGANAKQIGTWGTDENGDPEYHGADWTPASTTSRIMAKAKDVASDVYDSVANDAADPAGSAERAVSNAADTTAAALKGLGGEFHQAMEGINIVGGAFPVLYDKLQSMVTGKETTAAQDYWFKSAVDPLTDQDQAFEIAKTAGLNEKIAHSFGSALGFISQAVLTGGESAAVPATATTGELVRMVTEHGIKASSVPATTSAIDTGRKVYAETGNGDQAIKAAQMQYLVTSAGAIVPLAAEGTLPIRAAQGAVSGAATGEASRVAMNTALPPEMQTPYSDENLLLSATGGAVLGAGGGHGRPQVPEYQEGGARPFNVEDFAPGRGGGGGPFDRGASYQNYSDARTAAIDGDIASFDHAHDVAQQHAASAEAYARARPGDAAAQMDAADARQMASASFWARYRGEAEQNAKPGEKPEPEATPEDKSTKEGATAAATEADDAGDIKMQKEPNGATVTVKGTALLHFDTVAKAEEVVQAAKEQVDERRIDLAGRERVENMTPEEMRQELLTHPVTGIPNRRAWDEMDKGPAVAMLDADGLKYINDVGGHGAGDQHLKAIATALDEAMPGQVAHLGGDEFAAHAQTPEELDAGISRAKGVLARAKTTLTHPDGSKTSFTGIGLSHGTGATLDEADTNLAADKQARTEQGLRAARGEPPIGSTTTPPPAGVPGQQGGASGQVEVLGQKIRRPGAPTEAQKKSGTYFKPVVQYHGLPIRVENVAGGYRSGVSPGGKVWKTRMKGVDYGYFEGTQANDGDGVDVFMGKKPDNGKAYVIDQLDRTGKHFDEHKVVVGVDSEQEAMETYLAHYEKGWRGFGGVTELPVGQLKEWLKHDDHTRPIDADSVPTPKVKRGAGPDPRHDSVLEYLARHPRGLDSEEAQTQGIDPADMALSAAHVGIKRAFRKGGMSFDHAAETLHQEGYPVDDDEGHYSPNVLLDKIDSELRGRKVYSTRNAAASPESNEVPPWRRAASEAELDRMSEDALEARIRSLESEFGEGIKVTGDEIPFSRVEEEGFKLASPAGKAGEQPTKREAARGEQQDLFGDKVALKNELEKAKAALAKKRHTGQESVETGKPGDLFSQSRQQTEIPTKFERMDDLIELRNLDKLSIEKYRNEAKRAGDTKAAQEAQDILDRQAADEKAALEHYEKEVPPEVPGHPYATAMKEIEAKRRLEANERNAKMEGTLTEKLERLEQEHTEVQAEEHKQYHLFTRTARGKPVDPAITRRLVEIEQQIAALKSDMPEGLVDVGEKIGGARKDLWKERGLRAADLDTMSEGEGANIVNKHAVWKPDWQKMVEGGMPKETAALAKVMWDKIGTRPRVDTPIGRRQYVETLTHVVDLIQKATTPESVRGTQGQLMQILGMPNDGYSINRTPAEAEARDKFWSIHRGRHSVLHPGYADKAAAEKLIAAGWPAAVEPWTRHYIVRQGGDGKWRVYTKKRQALGEFNTETEAKDFGREHYEAEKAKGGAEEPMPERPHLTDIERAGPPVRVGDATGQKFIDDFGFRGLEFGNWAANDERQMLLNHAYDAMQDLARVLDIPPKALSLNGTLGLALGARGKGKAAAHYETGKLVINMTKINGAGSLAHEWAHAVDHYFGEYARADSYQGQARGASGWYSDPTTRTLQHLRPEMQEAWHGVMKAIFHRDVTQAEFIRGIELVNEKRQAVLNQQKQRQMTAEGRPPGERDVSYIRRNKQWIADEERSLARAKAMLEERRTQPDEPGTYGQTKTTYVKGAEGLSGKQSGIGYWRRPTELFARAFESFIQDKIAAEGGKSQYLVHHTEGERYAGHSKGNPYPFEDRPAINNAMQKLVDTLETRNENGKEVMFSRAENLDLDAGVGENARYEVQEPAGGRGKAARDVSAPGQLDIFANAAAPGPARAAARISGQVSLRNIGKFHTGYSKVEHWSQAAHILAPLRKSPQEIMAALVVDKGGKPLAVIRHQIGMINGAGVEIWSLIGSIAQVPHAAGVYFAHNHPSAIVSQSAADENITANLDGMLADTGIKSHGMIVVGPGKKIASYYRSDMGEGQAQGMIAAAARNKPPVPLQERRITKIAAGTSKNLSSPSATMNYVSALWRDGMKSGVILLDNRHNIVGDVAMSPEQMLKLRTNDPSSGVAAFLADATRGNANGMIVFGPHGAALNVAAMGNKAAMRVLDVITISPDEKFTSLAEHGQMPSGLEPFFSRGGGTGGLDKASIRDQAEATLREFKTQPSAVVVHGSLDEARQDPELAGRLERADPKVAAFLDPVTSKLHIIADQVRSATHLAGLMAHENVVHFGLRASLGDRRNAEYMQLLDNVAKALPAEVRMRGEREFPGGYNPMNRAHRAIAAEEALAYYAQAQAEGGAVPPQWRAWVDKFMQMLRDWFRSLRNLPPKYDDLYIRNVINDLREFLRRNQREPGGPEAEPAFGRAEDTFYSGVARAVDAAKREKGTGAEWEATLRNMPGVKAEEVQWLGLKEFLEGKGRVTKQEIADYVHDHRIQLGEVIKREEETPSPDEERIVKEIQALGYDVDEGYMDEEPLISWRGEADDETNETKNAAYALLDQLKGESAGLVKYRNYATPGGENYHEMLMTLKPRGNDAVVLAKRKAIFDKYQPALRAIEEKHGRLLAQATTGDERQDMLNDLYRERDAIEEEREREAESAGATIPEPIVYQTPHWDEMNVLAHVRFDDRTGQNGEKVLHIHELQSDWHQRGRKFGYKAGDTEQQMQQLLNRRRVLEEQVRDAPKSGPTFEEGEDLLSEGGKLYTADGPGGELRILRNLNGPGWGLESNGARLENFVSAEDAMRYAQTRYISQKAPPGVSEELAQIRQEIRRLAEQRETAVPNAPFKTSWPELVMKRMLRRAAEGGYDTLSWDTGATNADRYNLGHVVDHIRISNAGEDLAVGGFRPGLYNLLARQGNHTVGEYREIDAKKLTSLVGKEMTQKVLDSEAAGNHRIDLRGDDLRLGGAGMNTFYDQMLPAAVNKITKRWGSSVRPETLEGPGGGTHFDIYAAGGAQSGIRERGIHIGNLPDVMREMAQNEPNTDFTIRAAEGEGGGYGVTYRDGKYIAQRFDAAADSAPKTFDNAQAALAHANYPLSLRVHAVDITPAMRESVMQGQPMFSRGQQPLGPLPQAPTFLGKTNTAAHAYDMIRRAVISLVDNRLVMDIRKLVNPRSVSETSKRMAQETIPYLAELAQQREQTIARLEQFARAVDRLSYKDQLAAYDAAENGRPQPIAAMQPVMDAVQSALRYWADQVRQLGEGHLDNVIENYLPHYYTDESKAKKFFAGPFGRRPMRGPATFRKARYHATLKDAMEIGGLTPLTANPLIQGFLKIAEMQRYISGVMMMRAYKASGQAEFFPMSQRVPDGWKEIDDPIARVSSFSTAEGGFVQRGRYAMPEDAARLINNHLGTNHLANFSPAMVIRAFASTMTAMQLGFSGFHVGFTTFDSIVSRNALAYERMFHGEPVRAAAAFAESLTGPLASLHNVYNGYQLMKAYLNPSGATPELRQLVRAFIAGGMRTTMDQYFQAAQGVSPFKGVGVRSLAQDIHNALTLPQGKVAEITKVLGHFPLEYAMRHWSALTAIARTFPKWQIPFEIAGRITRASTSWIMEKVVPLQKAGVFSDMARDWMRRNPNSGPVEQAKAMQSISHSVDNRLGEVVYDNNFWNRSFKFALHLALRAVGWRFGTVQEIVGGPIDIIKALDKAVRTGKYDAEDLGHKVAYLLGLVTMQAISGALLQWLMCGEAPRDLKDLMFPRTGRHHKDGTEERLSLPSYIKDIYGYLHHPLNEVKNMANPVWGAIADQISGQDYFGNPIFNPDASAREQWEDRMSHFFVGGYTPFSIEGSRQFEASKDAGARGAFFRTAPFYGLTPASGMVTKPEKMDEFQHHLDQVAWQKKLRFDLKKAVEAGDKERAAEIRKQLGEENIEIRKSRQQYLREKAAGKKEAAKDKTSGLIEHLGPLIDSSSSRADMAAKIQSAGYPALAGLISSMPATLRPQVAAKLAEYA